MKDLYLKYLDLRLAQLLNLFQNSFCSKKRIFLDKFVKKIVIFLANGCLFTSILGTERFAEDFEDIFESSTNEITLDLKDPYYSDGVLRTEHGGVLQAPSLRIQGRNIRYSKKKGTCWTIEAEGDLIVEFGKYIFVGDTIFYDFQTREGTIQRGFTSLEPWFFGGERLELKSDGSYRIHHGYLSTSEREPPDWGIYANDIEVEKDRSIKAHQISLKAFDWCLIKFPFLRASLSSIYDNPIRYRFRWGGRQGPRIGLTYEIFSWEHWKTFFRFDYRLTRGPGAGLETYYHSQDQKTQFENISYLAKDSSILHPHEKARYRFEGSFKKLMDQDKTSILLTYDKISDKDMPSVYYDRDFDFDTAERTQLKVRRQEEDWIGIFYTRARINSFQTVKQELPTIEARFKPYLLQYGLIIDQFASASYLNFEYSKYLLHIHNYSSSRLQYFPTLYRPIIFGPFLTLTPEIGGAGILYGDSQRGDSQGILQGRGGVELQTQGYRYYDTIKHIVEPYAIYRYFTSPTSSPNDHYIFDISDGLTHLNYLSFGLRNSFFKREASHSNIRFLSADFYSFSFFDTREFHRPLPRVYSTISFIPFSIVKHTLETAWNLKKSQVDYLNFRTDWTLSDEIAIAAEYRYRGPFWWRKVDFENFFLDIYHPEQVLLHSQLSDRSETFLLHLFYRWHPNWALELTSRHGWNRRKEPSYTEFECDILTTIQTAWNVRLSYQHQENDDRIALFINVGLKRPSILKEQPKNITSF